jgi:cation:H+ antiporter
MDALIYDFIFGLSLPFVILVVVVTLVTLSKGADIFVDEAVSLSVHWRVPKMIIGTTIVSIGTTLPEAAVSVMAAIKGNPDLALGNAIGSIIVDTGLILGIAAMIGKLPIDRRTVNRQGNLKVLAGILLAVASIPFVSKASGGNISQFMGFVFLALLCIYIVTSIKWGQASSISTEVIKEERIPVVLQLLKFSLGAAIVIISSRILIPSVEITASRIGIPQSVIAATLVAFGTSLPELVTAVTAVKKGHGELAIGNVIGADILNVLFVVGAAAAVTKGGLVVPVEFFRLHIPTMLILLFVFRAFVTKRFKEITKPMGLVLLGIYVVYIFISYAL